jgi:hypothetical protein
MAHDTTGVKAVPFDGWRQLNVKVPHETGETLDRLKAVCNVPLVDLVKMSIDLFSRAHETEQKGGRIIFVQADGTRQEVQLPHMEVRVRSEPGEAPEARAAS